MHGAESVHLQILLPARVGNVVCSRSVAGHSHRKVIGRDPVCVSQHDMGLDRPGNGTPETMYDERDRNLSKQVDM